MSIISLVVAKEMESLAISVVVPVYQEAQSIRPFLSRIEPILLDIGPYELLFCMDPCSDDSELIIRREISRNPSIGLLVFSRRFGQPAATMAGILHCRGQSCVVIDVDLQDPPELIPELHTTLQRGYEVVYARRVSRRGESPVKLAVASLGYRLIAMVSTIPIPTDTGDFRIMSRRMIEELRRLPDRDLFLRGMVAYVGFRQTYVDYHRDARAAGFGKYNPFVGSLRIASNGLIGFSTRPLDLLLWSGSGLAIASGSTALLLIIMSLVGSREPFTLVTLALLILFVGAVQLMGLGLLGAYIGRIYDEVRRRPRYIIDHAVNVSPLQDVHE